MKYDCFHLVLMVTHQCNLRCDYCYTGRKLARAMSPQVGRVAIDRAVRSLTPGATLELGFFGGEPLLEADLVAALLEYARERTTSADVQLRAGLTTNGTVLTQSVWRLMLLDDLDVCVSCDGLPEIHDRHRQRPEGGGTAAQVLATIAHLLDAGRPARVMMVVRPDTGGSVAEGIQYLRDRGVTQFDLALDVWAAWKSSDMVRLEESLIRVARVWLDGLPQCGINWFDEKAGRVMGTPADATARCGFGDGEIAVAPSGRLYPCERLIGEDQEDHPMRLPGNALDGSDFCRDPAPARSAPACSVCAIAEHCSTTCRCNNYVRTGDVQRPDALLCLLDRICLRETAGALGKLTPACHAPCNS